MTTVYDPATTALLIVDPYNDFLSEGGKLWPHAEAVAKSVDLHEHMRRILAAARAAGIRVFFVPHRRTAPGDYEGWARLSASQAATRDARIFEQGSWGGTFHPDFQPADDDIVVHEHWSASGFANTDLDLQLKQRGISHVVLIGMRANTCIDTTARFAQELGYHVTLVKDAIAAFHPDEMHATVELNAPTYAHAIPDTRELLDALPSHQG
ncbi:isochorismatase family cysteine hydrolase [Embleya sp. NPDC001921]